MNPEEVARFVADNVEPLKDTVLGNRYRVAAHLKDGTYLPCVVLQSRQKQIEVALRRFKQLRWKRSQYRAVVESFVCAGSRVADDQLKNVEISPFAWPIELLRNIHREISLGWTAFVAEMKDGTMHSYGTSFNVEFFELPEGYSCSSITKIHSGVVYAKAGGLEKFSMEVLERIQPYREMAFFTSYLKALDDVG